MSPQGAPASRSNSLVQVEEIMDHWVRLLEHPGEAEAIHRSDTWVLRDDSPDTEDVSNIALVDGVALVRVGSRFVYPGSVAIRGPAAPDRASYSQIGLSEQQAAALEFVLGWFGAPFDTVGYTPDHRPGAALTWGIWAFAGPALAGCLSRWKRRAPEAYDSVIHSRGLDVTDGGAAPALVLLELGQPAGISEATDARVARDPRLVAALALAGREPSAQTAQLETVASDSLAPALALELRISNRTARVGDAFRSPRALGVVYYAVLRYGLPVAARLLQSAAPQSGGSEDEVALLNKWMELLHRSGRQEDVRPFLQILTSPELRTG